MAAAGLALLLMTGCSSDGTTSPTSEPISPSVPETTVETAPRPADESPDEVQDTSESPPRPEAPIATGDGATFAPSDVTPPPPAVVERLSLDTAFYRRHLDAMGISVVSSERVSPHALAETRWIVERMLEQREDIAETIARSPVRIAIMAVDEYTTDIPEHADLTPSDWWDVRARGLGATDRRPAQSVGEENLLALDGDPYFDESIMVHEFAHVVHQQAMNTLDPGFDDRLQALFERATEEEGLWEGTYAASNRSEYFAEGVQSWFDTNSENNAEHGPVDTREELASYDPRLAALLGEVFGDNTWRYRGPRDRETRTAHLEGFDRNAATAFEWPVELLSIDTRREPSANGVLLANVLDEDWSAERSPGTDAVGTVLRIFNRRSTDLGLRWIDFDGERVAYDGIAANGSVTLGTFPGHLFEITGPDGAVIGRYRAPLGDGIIEIGD